MRRLVPVLLAIGVSLSGCGEETGQDTILIDTEEDTMELTSAFGQGETIPTVYTCDGDDISPPLTIGGIPAGAETLALTVEDPDAPNGTFDHWVAFDIPLSEAIPENAGTVGTSGRNSAGDLGYTGPCPPSGTHRYVFQVFALDGALGLAEGATKQEVLEAAEGHILGEGTLVGEYGA